VRYIPSTLSTRAARIQLTPVMMAPSESRRRGPNLSIRKPWHGERNVCSTMSSEKVTWSCASSTPSCFVIGVVKSAQTYCGLEMTIMQTRPRIS
jgi:hypothetical protein